MAKSGRGRRLSVSRQCRKAPYPLPSYDEDALERLCSKKSLVFEKKNWEDITCSVCMEFPHNAVLLLCSSHGKGCRPYMCGTSYRHSNCLDQYKKAYTKLTPNLLGDTLRDSDDYLNLNTNFNSLFQSGKEEVGELACPLCRGQVKGCTVVEPARDFLNGKKRNCMQEDCSFVGNYKELRKHVKADHPCARPREVDPAVEQKWQRFQSDRERQDVMSTITSSMPGAMFFGDYVIENDYGSDDDDDEEGNIFMDAARSPSRRDEGGFDRSSLANVVFLLHAFGSASGAGSHRWSQTLRTEISDDDEDPDDQQADERDPTTRIQHALTNAGFDDDNVGVRRSDDRDSSSFLLAGGHHGREGRGHLSRRNEEPNRSER